jgi:hypothetical protein
MNLCVFIAILFLAQVSARPPRSHELSEDYSYEQYLIDFDKEGSAEGKERFISALSSILQHNKNAERSYSKGVNAFTDEVSPPKGRSPSPISSKGSSPLDDPRVLELLANPSALPASVDWRTAGKIKLTSYKNRRDLYKDLNQLRRQ